jgi:opacity protein-like surface antigen
MSVDLTRLLAGLGLCASLAAPVHAQYRTEFATGWGDDDTQMYRLGLARDWQRAWFTDGDWQLGGYWLAEVGYWDSDERHADNDSLSEVGLTPGCRLAPKAGHVRPYLEAGVGGHVLSDTRIGGRELSTAWQFGSHLGAGISCGRFDIGYRFQHLSNANIKNPNDGIDFHSLNAGLRW